MEIKVPIKAYKTEGTKNKKAKYHLRDLMNYPDQYYSVDKFFLDFETEIDIMELNKEQCCKKCFCVFNIEK